MDQQITLQEHVKQALETKSSLQITAGHSKDFYGRKPQGKVLSIAGHQGIVEYDFRELVITARTGSTIDSIKLALAENNQMLAFEPPVFNANSTLGGTLACGFSGPSRPYLGSARDFLLGTKIINGKAEVLSFGGQVMKNVAGYDLSRLMVGAMGTLGIMLEASMKVLPRPETEMTLVLQKDIADAIVFINQLAGRFLPVSASMMYEDKLYIRLSGYEKAVQKAHSEIGGELLEAVANQSATEFWQQLRDQQHSFFNTDKTLWRLSLPASTPELKLAGKTLYEWGGAQRWFIPEQQIESDQVFAVAAEAGGHASQFKNGDRHHDVFQPLSGLKTKIHQQLKTAMDPQGILNPGRLYQSF